MNTLTIDESTRRHALEELESDVAGGWLYRCPWLTPWGQEKWPDLLRRALREYDADWLASHLTPWMATQERVRRPMTREYYHRPVPRDAARILAQSEFNRFIARGVCAQAVAEGRTEVDVREEQVDRRADPQAVLKELRRRSGRNLVVTVP